MKERRVLSFVSVSAILLTMFLSILVAGVSAAPVLPSGATTTETGEKLVLEPGTVDWVIGSAAAFVHGVDGQTYYTDYAKPWAQNSQADSDSNTNPEKYLYARGAAVAARNGDYYWGGFMGNPVYSVYCSNAPWCHGGMVFRAKGGTYLALALVINRNKNAEIANEYVFETSADGSTWTALNASISLDFDAADPLNNADGKSPVASVYKAVVQIPGTASDILQFRVTLPGGVDNGSGYTWPGKNYQSTVAQLGTIVASATDLTTCKTLSEVPEFKTPVLSPGVYDDLSSDYYYSYNIRSTWNNANDVNWNDAAGYAKTFTSMTNDAWGADWPQLLGRFMGQVITKSIFSNVGWNGSALIYEVEPNSYVATALIGGKPAEGEPDNEHLQHFGFDVSADKTAWTSVTATITRCAEQSGDKCYFGVYKAVVKIPEGMKYYRVTLPGFNREATNGNEITWGTRDPDCEASFKLGGSVASAYDLSTLDSLDKVPDSPLYVDLKAELKAALVAARAIELNKYKNDAAKDTFISTLAEAEALLLTEDTHDNYKAMATRLTDATEALSLKDVPCDATIAQEDERKVLKPGVADWLLGSAFTDEAGQPLKAGDGIHTWYGCYSDYALGSMLSKQDDLFRQPQKYIHITNYDFFIYDKLAKLSFMGRPIEQVFVNTTSWAASNIKYHVYAGSYVSSAIVVNTKASSIANFPDIQTKYTFQVSADDKTWETVTPVLSKLQTEGDFELYKAVAKIPDGRYYYRVVMPGATSISEDTTWYSGGVNYEHTFLGPTIASMYDLSGYTDYAEVPDATAWYADAALSSKDTEKVQITEGYFKSRVTNMTIAQAMAELNTETAGVCFYTADGTAITDDSTKLAVGMKVDILDSKGISLSKALGQPMLLVASGNDVLSIGQADAIELEYGAKKTAAGLKLPATVKIEAGSGIFDATVNWNVAGSTYDPAISQTQAFTVSGTVLLPNGVSNNSDMDLTVTVDVTVLGSTDYGVLSTDTSKAKVDQTNEKIYVKEGLTLAELSEFLTPVGDVVVAFASQSGEDITDLSAKAERGMTVDVYTDVVLIKSYEIAFLADDGTSPDPGDSGDVSAPKSGDSSSALYFLWLALAAAGCGIVTLVVKKRRA